MKKFKYGIFLVDKNLKLYALYNYNNYSVVMTGTFKKCLREFYNIVNYDLVVFRTQLKEYSLYIKRSA